MGVLKGGHIGSGGGRIGMTNDQMTHFRDLLSQAVQDINTDSAFTAEQKRDLIKAMPGMSDKNHNFYDFLNTQYQSGPALAEYIRQYVSEDRPRNTRGPKGTKKK